MRGPIGPDVRLPHRADCAVLDPLGHQPVALKSHALVSHLRGNLMLPRGLGQGAGFVDRVRERLLAVDVLSPPDGRHRNDRMRMVRRAHDDRVDALLLVEHLAEVFVFRGPWILVEACAAYAQSTSAKATMFWLLTFSRSALPRPPMPTPAMFSFSLGGVWPGRRGHGGEQW